LAQSGDGVQTMMATVALSVVGAPILNKVAGPIARGVGSKTKGPVPKQGIYEFKDAANPGRTYVGQSGNIAKRLGQHSKAGRLAPGTRVKTTKVGGGKLFREVAEQGRINKLGGTRNIPGSRTSNKRNPVSKRRQKKHE